MIQDSDTKDSEGDSPSEKSGADPGPIVNGVTFYIKHQNLCRQKNRSLLFMSPADIASAGSLKGKCPASIFPVNRKTAFEAFASLKIVVSRTSDDHTIRFLAVLVLV